MSIITIEKPKSISTDNQTVKVVMSSILSEYSDFDIGLMKKYYETKDLDESNFVNI